MNSQFDIAYFSAEIGISVSLPTYSGGLGVLAGDHLKAAGDMSLKICGISLLYRQGYFKQDIDENGLQVETYPRFSPEPLLKKVDVSFSIILRKRKVQIEVYQFNYLANTGHAVPIFFWIRM